jgi:hypothetical protein
MPIKGEFSILALFLHILLVAVAGVAYWQMSPLFTSGEISFSDPEFYIAVPLFAVFTVFAVISPFVSIKNILIDDSSIKYKYLLTRKIFNLQDVDGYFTMELPSRDTTYETIYPVSRNIILPPISSFYISNYDEVKKALPLKNMGKVKFSWKNYMLVLFFKKYNELDR